jgi:hypothetical protein
MFSMPQPNGRRYPSPRVQGLAIDLPDQPILGELAAQDIDRLDSQANGLIGREDGPIRCAS